MRVPGRGSADARCRKDALGALNGFGWASALLACTLVLPLLASAAVAAGDDMLASCLAGAADPADCVGSTIEACVAALPGGETTVGIVACIGAETEAWDARLNAEYRTTMAEFETLDATGDVVAADFTRADRLREAQRAWIAFRDAECALQYARWGMGTLRQVAGANCLLEETGERALELSQMREPE